MRYPRRVIRYAIRQVKGTCTASNSATSKTVLNLPETGGKAELPGVPAAIRSFDWLRLAVPDQAQHKSVGWGGLGSRPASGSDGNSMICLDVIGREQEGRSACVLR